MHSQTLARSLAAGAVIVAAALVLLVRAPVEVSPSAPADPRPAVQTEGLPAARAEPTLAAASLETPAAAKERELQAMSETFRNSTFLIAIRGAGFHCNELLRVSGGLDGSSKWLATCSEMLAYTVAVASNGALQIQPMMQYFDGLGVQTIELEFEPSQIPPQPLPEPR